MMEGRKLTVVKRSSRGPKCCCLGKVPLGFPGEKDVGALGPYGGEEIPHGACSLWEGPNQEGRGHRSGSKGRPGGLGHSVRRTQCKLRWKCAVDQAESL